MPSGNGDPGSPIRLVVADDTPEVRFLIRVALEADGRFTVVGEAENGREAVALIDAERPDAVVLDLAMPVMDGLDAIPLIAGAHPETKIVVLSAFDAHQMQKAALDRGAHAYVEKGAAIDDLVEVMLALCA